MYINPDFVRGTVASMSIVVCVSSNDPLHDAEQCEECSAMGGFAVHRGVYKCSHCDEEFRGERVCGRHVAGCPHRAGKPRGARVGAKRKRPAAAAGAARRLGRANAHLRSALGAERRLGRASTGSLGGDASRRATLGLQPATTEYCAALDEELDQLIGRVCRVREAARRGVKGPLLGYIVSALSPRVVNVEVLTLQASKVGPHYRQGFHRHGRKMMTVAMHDISLIASNDGDETDTHTEVASALLFDLSVKQQVWRGCAAFCDVSPGLFRPTLRSLARLQNADNQRLSWKDDAPRQSLHPDRCTRYIKRLFDGGWVHKDVHDTMMRFVSDAFVRVCNTLE